MIARHRPGRRWSEAEGLRRRGAMSRKSQHNERQFFSATDLQGAGMAEPQRGQGLPRKCAVSRNRKTRLKAVMGEFRTPSGEDTPNS